MMKFMKVGMGVLSAAMMLSMATPVGVKAKKTSVYVVSRYKGDESFFPNQTITYNKDGLIRKIKQTGDPNTDEVYDSSGTDIFTYKKNKISKVVIKEDSRIEVDTPVYKGKKLNSLKFTSKSPDTTIKGEVFL